MPKRQTKAPTSRGLRKKDLESGRDFGDTAYIKKGDSLPVQFLQEPDDFLVFQEHQWDEDRKWFFVPCLGEECPLCDDESDDRAKTAYQWAAQVYNHKERKSQILKGGKDLGRRVWDRYEKKPSSFTKRVFEVTKYATQPISFDVQVEPDEKPIALSKAKPLDLEAWREKQVKAYFGDEIPKSSDLEDEDDEDEEEWEDEEENDENDDLDDDEDDDEEEDEDDEEDEDEDEPSKRKAKAAPKKSKAGKRRK